MHAPKGYRLLDLAVPSNRPVPLRGVALDVTVTHASGPDTIAQATTDADGIATIDDADAEGAVASVTVTDLHGNVGVGAPVR
jgi:hypothetical protein